MKSYHILNEQGHVVATDAKEPKRRNYIGHHGSEQFAEAKVIWEQHLSSLQPIGQASEELVKRNGIGWVKDCEVKYQRKRGAERWNDVSEWDYWQQEIGYDHRIFLDVKTEEKPIGNEQNLPSIIERFADNGEHIHWELIDREGKVLWSEETKRYDSADEACPICNELKNENGLCLCALPTPSVGREGKASMVDTIDESREPMEGDYYKLCRLLESFKGNLGDEPEDFIGTIQYLSDLTQRNNITTVDGLLDYYEQKRKHADKIFDIMENTPRKEHESDEDFAIRLREVISKMESLDEKEAKQKQKEFTSENAAELSQLKSTPSAKQQEDEDGKGEDVESNLCSQWQLCPKCQGQGIVSRPPWIAADVIEWSSTQTSFPCDVCNGAKIITTPSQRPLQDNKEEGK